MNNKKNLYVRCTFPADLEVIEIKIDPETFLLKLKNYLITN